MFEKKDGFANSDQGTAAFRRLKEQLREAARKASNGEAILLEEGITAKQIAINSKDAETTSSFTQQVMRICGLMDVPPHRIYALESVAYSNLASMDRTYASHVLEPLAVNIETKFRNHSLPEEQWPIYVLQFDRQALAANDPDTLEKLLKTAMSLGLMSFDEGREALPFRLGRLKDGGDRRMVPVNMSLWDENGGMIQAASGQNPTQPEAGQSESEDNNASKAGPRLVHDAGAA